MSEVRELFEKGAAMVGGNIRHGRYVHPLGLFGVCGACVNGAIALGYLEGRAMFAYSAETIEAYVPLLRVAVGEFATYVCPACGEIPAWWERRAMLGVPGVAFNAVTVRMLIDHLFEDHGLPAERVIAYVEALTADLELAPVPEVEHAVA